MARLLVPGIVALLVLTGCLPSSQVPDAPVRSGAVPSAPSSVDPTIKRQPPSGSAGDASTSAESVAPDPGPEDVATDAVKDHHSSEGEPQPASDPEWGPLHDVLSVYDGDTIAVSLDGARERVRIIGIDAPEMARSGTAAECYAQPATSRLQHLMQSNRVHLLADPTQADRDRYDRLLRHVVLDGGGHVALILLEEGYVVERQYAAPYQWQPELRAAQERAQANGLGLWAACATPANVPVPPVTPVRPSEPAPPVDPAACVIKGNINNDGERIYHVPGQQYYGDTVVSPQKGERWFCSEEEAIHAGWRKAKS